MSPVQKSGGKKYPQTFLLSLLNSAALRSINIPPKRNMCAHAVPPRMRREKKKTIKNSKMKKNKINENREERRM